MPRFLSPEWFALVETARPDGATPAQLVLRQVVTGTPDGDVTYDVAISGDQARISRPSDHPAEADLTITSDWATAAAIAQGRLSTQRALMQGRLRMKGSVARISSQAEQLAGLDPLPPAVRQKTTY